MVPGMPDRNSSPVSPAAAACSATVTSSAAAPATTPSGFDRDRAEAARQPDHHARQSAVADDQVGAGADHMHRHVERQRAQELREVVGVGRADQHLGGAADAEPGERRQRRIRLHAAAQRRQRSSEQSRIAARAAIMRAALRRARIGRLRAPATARQFGRQRCGPLRDGAGAEADDEIAGLGDRVHHLGQPRRARQRHHAAMAARPQPSTSASRSRRRSAPRRPA